MYARWIGRELDFVMPPPQKKSVMCHDVIGWSLFRNDMEVEFRCELAHL